MFSYWPNIHDGYNSKYIIIRIVIVIGRIVIFDLNPSKSVSPNLATRFRELGPGFPNFFLSCEIELSNNNNESDNIHNENNNNNNIYNNDNNNKMNDNSNNNN